ncbi:hypothetical protein ACOSQ3_026396 [Xanthoceras sorbifolium]
MVQRTLVHSVWIWIRIQRERPRDGRRIRGGGSVWDRERLELDRKLNKNNNNKAQGIIHIDVLKKTKESFLKTADKMVMENPELALIGSRVLVVFDESCLMKGEDAYVTTAGILSRHRLSSLKIVEFASRGPRFALPLDF